LRFGGFVTVGHSGGGGSGGKRGRRGRSQRKEKDASHRRGSNAHPVTAIERPETKC
jgi:hypothetical protein